MNYKDYEDDELLSYIQEENEEANEIMFMKYQPLIKSIAKNYYPKFNHKGLELSDLIQEGMIGLSYAITSYKEAEGTSFYTYAKTCIERKMLSLLVGTSRLKNRILNESMPIERDEELSFLDIISDDSINPEKLILEYEEIQEFTNLAEDILSSSEFKVFKLLMAGFNNKEIAELLDVEYKVIDNAIQRMKVKFKKSKIGQ